VWKGAILTEGLLINTELLRGLENKEQSIVQEVLTPSHSVWECDGYEAVMERKRV
jgi:hypothetical protein